MSLRPGEEIGMEVHKETDQFFRLENGQGTCIIDETQYEIESGDVIVVPAGAKHNVINTGATELKLYTIYSPPHHKDGIVQPTKNDATNSKEEFDGRTTELRLTYEDQVFLK
jgi:mannose-6-phosphate isomerase-like protein (cupin superfamily)